MRKVLGLGAALVLAAAAAVGCGGGDDNGGSGGGNSSPSRVRYTCSGGQVFDATFHDDSVTLVLLQIIYELPQDTSVTNGFRYADSVIAMTGTTERASIARSGEAFLTDCPGVAR